MRRFGRALVPALCLLFIAANACAQVPYPSKPIRILVPYAPGGLTDVVARLYSEQLRHRLGRGVFIDNKPGASGIIAIEEMARARPDGHTLMIGNISTNGLTPILLAKKMKIDYERDVQIITPLADVPVFFLATTTNFQPATFADFLVYAREHPRKVRYGSAGIGAISRSTPRSSPSEQVSTSCTFRSKAAAPRSSAISRTATSRCHGSTSPIRSA
jgi:tripartite-type tricarboxylate transporter receptor subunit TctC